jgi:hypothetical protein
MATTAQRPAAQLECGKLGKEGLVAVSRALPVLLLLIINYYNFFYWIPILHRLRNFINTTPARVQPTCFCAFPGAYRLCSKPATFSVNWTICVFLYVGLPHSQFVLFYPQVANHNALPTAYSLRSFPCPQVAHPHNHDALTHTNDDFPMHMSHSPYSQDGIHPKRVVSWHQSVHTSGAGEFRCLKQRVPSWLDASSFRLIGIRTLNVIPLNYIQSWEQQFLFLVAVAVVNSTISSQATSSTSTSSSCSRDTGNGLESVRSELLSLRNKPFARVFAVSEKSTYHPRAVY